MQLDDVMTSHGTCRFYKTDPIPDDVMARVLDAARWAPNGGNRQGIRLVVVKDAAKKAQLAEWYRGPWKAYVEGARAGQIDIGGAWKVVENADYFAEHLQDVPAIIVVCAKLDAIHPTDQELGRLSVVGGGSIYPGVQNMLLKAREEGLGTALTTLLCIFEPQVKELLGIPDDVLTAAHVAIGYPERPFPTKLNRMPLNEIVHLDSWGTALPGA
jgi:nitroreductase